MDAENGHDLSYSIGVPGEGPELIQFLLENFLGENGETIMEAVGVEPNIETAEFLSHFVNDGLTNPVSVVCREYKDRGPVVGVRTADILTLDEYKKKIIETVNDEYKDKRLAKFVKCIGDTFGDFKALDEHLGQAKKLLIFYILNVRKDARHNGIAKRMVEIRQVFTQNDYETIKTPWKGSRNIKTG